jgi:hypothetical protein
MVEIAIKVLGTNIHMSPEHEEDSKRSQNIQHSRPGHISFLNGVQCKPARYLYTFDRMPQQTGVPSGAPGTDSFFIAVSLREQAQVEERRGLYHRITVASNNRQNWVWGKGVALIWWPSNLICSFMNPTRHSLDRRA